MEEERLASDPPMFNWPSNNQYATVRKWFVNKLSEQYTASEAESFFRYLHPPTGAGFDDRHRFSETDLVLLLKAIRRLQHYEPIQYIEGTVDFLDTTLQVNPSVLIPRPETEELVQYILLNGVHSTNPLIWDVCTGSGCIAIALARHLPLADVWASDLSEDALNTAKQNATINHVHVQFVLDDVLQSSLKLPKQVDIMVSNPPYVLRSEAQEMDKNVLLHEPHMALFVPNDDPLLFYKAMLQLASNCLSEKGSLFFELNPHTAEEVKQWAESRFSFSATIIFDLSAKKRFLKVNRS